MRSGQASRKIAIGQADRTPNCLVGVTLEVRTPHAGDDENGQLTLTIGERPAESNRSTERLQCLAQRRAEQHGVERALQTSMVVHQPEQLRSCGPWARDD